MITSIRTLPSEAAPSLVPSHSGPTPRQALDDTLIEAIAAGDGSAMQVLYARHHVRIYRFALRFVNDQAAAEDVVNEVFLNVWCKARSFRRRSQVATWLYALARHKAIDLLRRRSPDVWDVEPCQSIDETADDPDTALVKKQHGSILLDCLSRLTLAHREIIDLVYYHGKTIEEAAAIIGVPRNTVKTRMFYARKHLVELLAEQGIVTAEATR